MGLELVAEHIGDGFDTLGDFEDRFAEFEKGELRIYVNDALTQEQLSTVENEILCHGAHLTAPVTQDGGVVFVRFQKRIAPLLILAAAGALVIVAVGGVLGWQVFRVVQDVPNWAWIVLGTSVAVLLIRTDAMWNMFGKVTETAGSAIRGNPARETYVLGIPPLQRILHSLEFDSRREASERARQENRYGEYRGRGVKVYKLSELSRRM